MKIRIKCDLKYFGCASPGKSESRFLPQEHETSEHNRRYLINFGVADLAESQSAIIGSPLIWINEV